MSQTSQRVWDRDAVVHLIETNDVALARALDSLYQRQTAEEQKALATKEHNGRGFNGRDAHFLSDIARKLPRYDGRMTPAQKRAVRKAIPKYWRQLLEEIEAKGGQVFYGVAPIGGAVEIVKPRAPAMGDWA